MGKLGFPVPQGVWVHKHKQRPQFVIAGESDSLQERTLDKVLAYSSFYVMLFAAFCAFLPAQTGTAFAYVKDLNPLPAISSPTHDNLLRRVDKNTSNHANWQLRSTSE